MIMGMIQRFVLSRKLGAFLALATLGVLLITFLYRHTMGDDRISFVLSIASLILFFVVGVGGIFLHRFRYRRIISVDSDLRARDARGRYASLLAAIFLVTSFCWLAIGYFVLHASTKTIVLGWIVVFALSAVAQFYRSLMRLGILMHAPRDGQ